MSTAHTRPSAGETPPYVRAGALAPHRLTLGGAASTPPRELQGVVDGRDARHEETWMPRLRGPAGRDPHVGRLAATVMGVGLRVVARCPKGVWASVVAGVRPPAHESMGAAARAQVAPATPPAIRRVVLAARPPHLGAPPVPRPRHVRAPPASRGAAAAAPRVVSPKAAHVGRPQGAEAVVGDAGVAAGRRGTVASEAVGAFIARVAVA